MLDKEFFLNIEKFASSTKLNGSLFFGRSFKNKDLNKLNDFILSYASNKSFLEIEGGINNWSRELEYPFIFSQIAKYINKSLDENGAKEIYIFDNACGYTAISALLAKAGLHIKGTDLFDHGERWKKYIKSIKGSMSFEQANSEELPFNNEKFDVSFSLSALEHMNNPQKALKEMIRVTKKGGLILLTIDIASQLVGNYKADNLNINNSNFDDILELINKECDYFAEPKLTHPDDYLNNYSDNISGSFVRKAISKTLYKFKRKDYPANFYIFGGAWLKKY